jgi:hypothetical protein
MRQALLIWTKRSTRSAQPWAGSWEQKLYSLGGINVKSRVAARLEANGWDDLMELVAPSIARDALALDGPRCLEAHLSEALISQLALVVK